VFVSSIGSVANGIGANTGAVSSATSGVIIPYRRAGNPHNGSRPSGGSGRGVDGGRAESGAPLLRARLPLSSAHLTSLGASPHAPET
jgi:hypothetical protein